MAAPQHTPNQVLLDNATPARMAAAGVPLALARWYYLIGRHLRRFSDWDIDRVMEVRLRIAQAGL